MEKVVLRKDPLLLESLSLFIQGDVVQGICIRRLWVAIVVAVGGGQISSHGCVKTTSMYVMSWGVGRLLCNLGKVAQDIVL